MVLELYLNNVTNGFEKNEQNLEMLSSIKTIDDNEAL